MNKIPQVNLNDYLTGDPDRRKNLLMILERDLVRLDLLL